MGELALTEEIKTLGLEKYAEELERDGLTIVHPEVNGFGMDRIDEIVELILARAREMTGCTFTLDGGPQQELEYPMAPERRERLLHKRKGNERTQFLMTRLAQQHRQIRDMVLNPVSLALQNFMMAGRTRLSSTNCIVKWKGDLRRRSQSGPACGPGWHTDPVGDGRLQRQHERGASPTTHAKAGPWPGFLARTGRANPGCPRSGSRTPSPPRRRRARSSCFRGRPGTARFPRKEEGLRLGMVVYHRHSAILPQEYVAGETTEEMVQDCENPEVYRVIAGLTDRFPYREEQESRVIPKVKGAPE